MKPQVTPPSATLASNHATDQNKTSPGSPSTKKSLRRDHRRARNRDRSGSKTDTPDKAEHQDKPSHGDNLTDNRSSDAQRTSTTTHPPKKNNKNRSKPRGGNRSVSRSAASVRTPSENPQVDGGGDGVAKEKRSRSVSAKRGKTGWQRKHRKSRRSEVYSESLAGCESDQAEPPQSDGINFKVPSYTESTPDACGVHQAFDHDMRQFTDVDPPSPTSRSVSEKGDSVGSIEIPGLPYRPACLKPWVDWRSSPAYIFRPGCPITLFPSNPEDLRDYTEVAGPTDCMTDMGPQACIEIGGLLDSETPAWHLEHMRWGEWWYPQLRDMLIVPRDDYGWELAGLNLAAQLVFFKEIDRQHFCCVRTHLPRRGNWARRGNWTRTLEEFILIDCSSPQTTNYRWSYYIKTHRKRKLIHESTWLRQEATPQPPHRHGHDFIREGCCDCPHAAATESAAPCAGWKVRIPGQPELLPCPHHGYAPGLADATPDATDPARSHGSTSRVPDHINLRAIITHEHAARHHLDSCDILCALCRTAARHDVLVFCDHPSCCPQEPADQVARMIAWNAHRKDPACCLKDVRADTSANRFLETFWKTLPAHTAPARPQPRNILIVRNRPEDLHKTMMRHNPLELCGDAGCCPPCSRRTPGYDMAMFVALQRKMAFWWHVKAGECGFCAAVWEVRGQEIVPRVWSVGAVERPVVLRWMAEKGVLPSLWWLRKVNDGMLRRGEGLSRREEVMMLRVGRVADWLVRVAWEKGTEMIYGSEMDTSAQETWKGGAHEVAGGIQGRRSSDDERLWQGVMGALARRPGVTDEAAAAVVENWGFIGTGGEKTGVLDGGENVAAGSLQETAAGLGAERKAAPDRPADSKAVWETDPATPCGAPGNGSLYRTVFGEVESYYVPKSRLREALGLRSAQDLTSNNA